MEFTVNAPLRVGPHGPILPLPTKPLSQRRGPPPPSPPPPKEPPTVEELDQECEELKSKLRIYRRKFSSKSKDWSLKKRAFQKEYHYLIHQIKLEKQNIGNHTTAMDGKDKETEILKGEKEDIQERLSEMKVDLAAKDIEIDALKDEKKGAQDQLASVKVDLASKESQINDLTTEKEDLKNKLTQARKDCEDKDIVVKGLNDEKDEFQIRLGSARHDRQQMDDSYNELQKSYEILGLSTDKLKEELKEARAKIRVLGSEKKLAEEQVEKGKKAFDAQGKEIATLKNKLAVKDSEIGSHIEKSKLAEEKAEQERKRAEAIVEDNRGIRDDLKGAKEARDALLQNYANLQASHMKDINELKDDLRIRNDEVAELQEALDESIKIRERYELDPNQHLRTGRQNRTERPVQDLGTELENAFAEFDDDDTENTDETASSEAASDTRSKSRDPSDRTPQPEPVDHRNNERIQELGQRLTLAESQSHDQAERIRELEQQLASAQPRFHGDNEDVRDLKQRLAWAQDLVANLEAEVQTHRHELQQLQQQLNAEGGQGQEGQTSGDGGHGESNNCGGNSRHRHLYSCEGHAHDPARCWLLVERNMVLLICFAISGGLRIFLQKIRLLSPTKKQATRPEIGTKATSQASSSAACGSPLGSAARAHNNQLVHHADQDFDDQLEPVLTPDGSNGEAADSDIATRYQARRPLFWKTVLAFLLHLVVYYTVFHCYYERHLWLAANGDTRHYLIRSFSGLLQTPLTRAAPGIATGIFSLFPNSRHMEEFWFSYERTFGLDCPRGILG